MQVELQCAHAVRDRLAEKLTNAEREAVTLKSSKDFLQAEVEREAQEAEAMRLKVNATEQITLDLRKEQEVMREELENIQAERDQLAIAVAEKVAKESAQQSDILELKGQIESLQKQLSDKSSLLDSANDMTKRLNVEKQELEVAFASYQQHSGTGENEQLKTIASLSLRIDKLSKQIEAKVTELGQEQGTTSDLQARNSVLKQQLMAAELQRKELHNAIQELKGNIRVYCRIRPPLASIEVSLHQPEPNKIFLRHGLDNYAFNFDKVWGTDAAQQEIFEEVSGLVQSALDGYKVCIFAYGQTGSGKTFTMQGEPGNEGLIPRTLLTIFNASHDMKARGWTFSLKVSFMEVYNETLRDLLRGSGDVAAGPTDGYVIAQHEHWGTMVAGMSCIEVDSIDKINSLMARAAKQRAVGATDVHAVSSRSHSVFGLYIKGVNQVLDSEVHGALHLVDLAGSERLDKSGSTGERLKETRNINRSLSSLADVFAAKAEGRGHVPFRNSKLTHLMEPCLSGQGKTLMLVSVAPEQKNSHETLCSLRFAKQVSQCNTGGKPRRSVKNLQAAAMLCGGNSPRTTEPKTITQKSRLSSDRSSQQVSMRRRATSLEQTQGACATPRGRSCDGMPRRVEGERSPRGATARRESKDRNIRYPERETDSRMQSV